MNPKLLVEKLNTWGIAALCEEEGCNGRLLHQQGNIIKANPPLFVHTCNACGITKYLDRPHPQMLQWPDGLPLPPELQAIVDAQAKMSTEAQKDAKGKLIKPS